MKKSYLLLLIAFFSLSSLFSDESYDRCIAKSTEAMHVYNAEMKLHIAYMSLLGHDSDFGVTLAKYKKNPNSKTKRGFCEANKDMYQAVILADEKAEEAIELLDESMDLCEEAEEDCVFTVSNNDGTKELQTCQDFKDRMIKSIEVRKPVLQSNLENIQNFCE